MGVEKSDAGPTRCPAYHPPPHLSDHNLVHHSFLSLSLSLFLEGLDRTEAPWRHDRGCAAASIHGQERSRARAAATGASRQGSSLVTRAAAPHVQWRGELADSAASASLHGQGRSRVRAATPRGHGRVRARELASAARCRSPRLGTGSLPAAWPPQVSTTRGAGTLLENKL
jgi:hypothetical protein